MRNTHVWYQITIQGLFVQNHVIHWVGWSAQPSILGHATYSGYGRVLDGGHF